MSRLPRLGVEHYPEGDGGVGFYLCSWRWDYHPPDANVYGYYRFPLNWMWVPL